ncbi:MAG TPA: exopolyphosphatase [Novosphingobium sp.]
MTAERAIIDIGSNTVRLVVYGGPARAPTVLLNEKVTAKLGKGLAENGRLSDKAMKVALAALGRYALLLRLRGVERVETVATAAARDATNGEDFLARVRALGLAPRLLSGEQEAVTSAMGVIGALPGAKGVVADLGGGSLELIHVEGGRSWHGASLPFGTLRLPGLRAQGPVRFSRGIVKALDAAEWHCAPGEALYLVGGSHRALARVAMHAAGWPIDDPHAFELSPQAALKTCRLVLADALPPAIPGLSASRRASLPAAAALLAVLVRELKPARLVFSAWGLREGLMYAALPAAEQALDPLLAGAFAFGQALGCAPADAAAIAGWTAPVAAGDETLRLAATLLALVSQRIEPNLRAGHIMDGALRKRWIGIDAPGRAQIAACALANAGRAAPAEALGRLAPADRLREAAGWGLAMRLCRRFSGLSAKVLAGSALSVEDGALTLTMQEAYAPLYTEMVEKDLKALAEHLGLRAAVRKA